MSYAVARLFSHANSAALIRDNRDKVTLTVDAVIVVSLLVALVVLISLSSSGVLLGSSGIIGYGTCVLGAGSFPILLFDTVVVLVCLNKSRQSQKRNRVVAQVPMLFLEKTDLFSLLFKEVFTQETLQSTPCLGDKIEEVDKKLVKFNKKYNTNLKVRGSQHSDLIDDPWQTIKITDQNITKTGDASDILVALNNYLFFQHDVQSNGGDKGQFTRGQKKRDPQCFKKNGIVMNPQIQLSRIDIRRVLGITTPDEYFKELQQAYHK